MDTLDLRQKKTFELISLFSESFVSRLTNQSLGFGSTFANEVWRLQRSNSVQITTAPSHVVDAFSDADHAWPSRDDNPCDD